MIQRLSSFGDTYFIVRKKNFPRLAFSTKKEAEKALELFKEGKTSEEIKKILTKTTRSYETH